MSIVQEHCTADGLFRFIVQRGDAGDITLGFDGFPRSHSRRYGSLFTRPPRPRPRTSSKVHPVPRKACNHRLLVTATGARWWRPKYRVGGKEKLLSLGVYPDVSLKLARKRRDELRRQLADGVDPGVKRKVEKAATADSFEAVARDWFAKFSANWAPAGL
jgi:hypothetical protein